jgi:hypothetical protein
MEAIGDDSQLRNRPLELDHVEQAGCTENRQAIPGVIPEVRIASQCSEWTEQSVGLAFRTLARKRLLERLEEIPVTYGILPILRMAPVCLQVKRKARRVVLRTKHPEVILDDRWH